MWLKENYNKYELPPTEDNAPVVVNVSIYLSSIIKIDDPTQVIKQKDHSIEAHCDTLQIKKLISFAICHDYIFIFTVSQ